MRLSVVMPAYNEQDCIAEAVDDICRFVLNIVEESNLIVIDDGSRDETGAILDDIAAKDSRVTVLHQPNGGHGRALMTGLDAADGEYLFLIDSDRQIPLSAFEALWHAAVGQDGAFGRRCNRADARVRIILTRVIRCLLPVLCGVRIDDANVPFKIIKRDVWREARLRMGDDTLAPSLLLAVYAYRSGLDVAVVDVPHVDRATGEVSIKRWKLFKFCARALWQLIALKYRKP